MQYERRVTGSSSSPAQTSTATAPSSATVTRARPPDGPTMSAGRARAGVALRQRREGGEGDRRLDPAGATEIGRRRRSGDVDDLDGDTRRDGLHAAGDRVERVERVERRPAGEDATADPQHAGPVGPDAEGDRRTLGPAADDVLA